jgi:hypothetical protein
LDVGLPGAWDDNGVHTRAVLFDEGIYKMWYNGYDENVPVNRTGYATSTDGINWVKHPDPVLDIGTDGDWDDAHVYATAEAVEDSITQMQFYVGNLLSMSQPVDVCLPDIKEFAYFLNRQQPIRFLFC